MKKLSGYENTFYPERWEQNGQQICKLRDGVYLIFTGVYERFFGVESEIVLRFPTLASAAEYCEE